MSKKSKIFRHFCKKSIDNLNKLDYNPLVSKNFRPNRASQTENLVDSKRRIGTMPATDQRPRAPDTVRLRAEESDVMCSLYAAISEIAKAQTILEKRLQSVPNGKRDLAMIQSVMAKLLQRIMKTVPIEKIISLQKNMRYMRYRVYMVPPASVSEDEVVITEADLAVLTQYAHEYSCIGCDKDCNQCKLGKALDHVLTQCRGPSESWTWIDPTKDYNEEDVVR